ncbi:C40 family peptidase [Segetibacter koreensis]|uniref:C40 family peptidase n=1 Tax=Segetibacter koreensis TaxID=398037 RepID=UPI000377C0D1|nr:C40 family peptidase [Segetibacter koreensis]
MAFLICMVPVCPIRADASHRSEQVSQLLFGEKCELLERSNEFVRVRVLYDSYEGWCQQTQVQETEVEIFSENKRLAGEWVNKILIHGQSMYVPFASSLTFLTDKGVAAKYNLAYNGIYINPSSNSITNSLIKKFAFMFLNTPYLWGGRSVFGIDCSGFTQQVFQCMNLPLFRDAYQQADQGETVEDLEDAKCGDIAFFDNEAGRITHTGILLDSNTIIHASGKVRIDAIDKLGIVHLDNGGRTHHLKTVKRIIKTVIID